MININDLVGVPFVDEGRSLDGFDCYGLVREVYKRFGVEIPEVNVSVYNCKRAQEEINEAASKEWRKINELQIPCVLLTTPHAGFAQHIACYIGSNKLIHTNINIGVLVEPLYKWKNKILGYYQYGDYTFPNS